MIGLEQDTLRAELEERRGRLATASRRSADDHVAHLLREVDSALARMDAGGFGICEACDESIEAERLAADPLVRLCLGCLSPAERRALEHDLEVAAEIQRGLLPERTTVHGRWEAHFHYEPLGVVSGDHCDLIRPDGADGDLYFLFGDISGKGVSASIVMAQLHAVFRSLVALGLPLGTLLERANHLICGSTPANFYATLVCGRLSPDGSMELCNAGHCQPLVRRGGTVEAVEATAVPLGAFSGVSFRTRTLRLGPGDTLLLYTDGLSESADGTVYELDHAVGVLKRGSERSAEGIVRAVLDDRASNGNGTPRSDDLTVMAIRRS